MVARVQPGLMSPSETHTKDTHMTLFQETTGQQIAAYLESIGVSAYLVGGGAVLFRFAGYTTCASSIEQARRIVFNITHAKQMDALRASRDA